MNHGDAWDFDPVLSTKNYTRRLLDSYRKTSTTAGHVRSADRQLAERLYQLKTPLGLVEAAFYLADARRIFRDPGATPLPPIRSLHYFLPVIEEIRLQGIDPEYIAYLAWKIDHADRFLCRFSTPA